VNPITASALRWQLPGNSTLSYRQIKTTWFWPTVAAALTSKHHWRVIVCDACGMVIDLDLTVKRRDPDAPIREALNDVRCPRCNGHGRTRIVGLARNPSIGSARRRM